MNNHLLLLQATRDMVVVQKIKASFLIEVLIDSEDNTHYYLSLKGRALIPRKSFW